LTRAGVAGPRRLLVGAALLLSVLAPAVPLNAGAVPADRVHAVDVVPPGQSGSFNSATFALHTAAGTSLGPNFADQLPLYRDWKYKPFQFEQTGNATHPGGRADVSVYYDSYGVPQIYAASEVAMTYALGYTMARDRLFQMDVFRHVGHGTLAEITGAGALPMDEATRRTSEGSAGRTAELNAAPQRIREEADAFTAGVNQLMTEQCGPSVAGKHTLLAAFASTCPAEFGLLNDPPADWVDDDTLAFGEYAARNFGEFDVGELGYAKTYVDMVSKLGQPAAEKAFNDLYPLDIPESPHIIPDADGIFPRHTGTPAPGASASSSYVNHDQALLPPIAALNLGSEIDARQRLIRRIQQQLGIPRWGSNAVVISGSRTASHNPILYSGPQTGWAVPGFFWEVETHTPERDTRGVTVPTIPLLVIGRNRDMGWSVTSAEGANASTFVETLDATNSHYLYKGQQVPLESHTETLGCNTPPTAILDLPGTSSVCPLVPETVTVYHTIHGPGLVDPTPQHLLFTRDTTVDHRFVKTLMAWDDISKTHTATDFGQTLSNLYLGFNFFYADAHGDIAYFHTGRYPIWASNIDPNLPQPGTGAYDWRGEEAYSSNPHVINPSSGFLVNWNNKPAKGWWTPATLGSQNWGAYQQAVQLGDITGASTSWTFDRVGQIPRGVAYTDHRARALAPYLVASLQGTTDATLRQVLAAESTYDFQRIDRGGGKMGLATTFFDRWLEYLNRDVFLPILGGDCNAYLNYTQPGDSRTACGEVPSHSISNDNQSAAAHKFDANNQDVLLRAFRGTTGGPQNQFDVFATDGGSAHAAAALAAREAAADLTAAQGADPTKWSTPVEMTCFSAQGAGDVPCYGPLQNRGSYAQVIEPLVNALVAAPAGPAAPAVLPNTAAAGPLSWLLAALLAAGGASAWRRRRRGAAAKPSA
jgi:penicillin amidase